MPSGDGELEGLLELIGDLQGMLDLDELTEGMIVALKRTIPSDYVSINDIGPDQDRVISVISPPQPEELYRTYGRLAFENPLTARYIETRDGRPYRFSDVISQVAYRELELYRLVYGPMGVEHQIAFTLPATPGRIIAVALSRRDPDYSDAERDLIERARPFLIQAWRTAIEFTAVREELETRPASTAQAPPRIMAALRRLGLTDRQAEVLCLIARGRSSRDAAAFLGISERTVQKHLQHAYRTLGVSDRSAAAELVWASGDDGAAPPERRAGLESRPEA